ncbi:MAG: aldolase/citrate lyase family protein [Terrimicrobiaceae bacterium]
MLKSKLRDRELSLGSWISIGNPSTAEIMARAGFEWLVVDLEHTAIGIEIACEMIRIIDLCGVTPLVRLTSNDANQIKRVMDAGAHGIVVPMVNNAEQARLAVSATRYAPKGTRGVGLSRAQGYGAKFAEYLTWQSDGPIVIVQIEHISAIDHLGEIISVPGVDGVIIGPYDLACSMEIPGQFANPGFLDAMARIRTIAGEHGTPVGTHIVEPGLSALAKAVSEGYTFIAYSVDQRMLDVCARAGSAKFMELKK